MLTLGFVSAILPDLNLEEVLAFAASNGFSCVELMCWPIGKAERRYAGITHIDVVGFTKDDAARVKDRSCYQAAPAVYSLLCLQRRHVARPSRNRTARGGAVR